MAAKNDQRPLTELSTLERDVLAKLRQLGTATGTDVADALDNDYASGVVYGSVSDALRRLQRDGLVESERSDDDKRTRDYRVTEIGRREHEADLAWREADD